MIRKLRRGALGIAAAGLALLAVGLLTQSDHVGEGVRRGIATCGNVLIPSLFPFMVLSGLLSLTDLGAVLSRPLAPFTRRVLKLPQELGAVVVLSLVGGYPVGAKSISSLLAHKKIDKETAERMLCFCVNSGPSFLITAVGAGMLLQPTAGVILFATQTAATLLIGIAVSWRAGQAPPPGQGRRLQGAEAFVAAVTGGAGAMLTMCAFAILFSGLLALLDGLELPSLLAGLLPVSEQMARAAISGFLEVTSGCMAAAVMEGETAFLLISAMVSFSGLSVLFQIISCFKDTPIRLRPFLLSRLAHILLSTAMALPLYRRFCRESMAWAAQAVPVMVVDRKTMVTSVCLLGMCSILFLSVKAPKSYCRKKRSRDCGGDPFQV